MKFPKKYYYMGADGHLKEKLSASLLFRPVNVKYHVLHKHIVLDASTLNTIKNV